MIDLTRLGDIAKVSSTDELKHILGAVNRIKADSLKREKLAKEFKKRNKITLTDKDIRNILEKTVISIHTELKRRG